MLKFFLSIKTSLWLTGLSIGVFLAGSFYIPQNLALFSEVNDMPLFRWLVEQNGNLNKIYWIYLLIGLMLLLWINTIVCSIDAIIKKTTWKGLVRVLSPQVLHFAILFVLVGYCVSASTGYKKDITMDMIDLQTIEGFELKINNIEFFTNPGENSPRWRVYLNINGNESVLELGRPTFYNGVGFFAKSAQQRKMKAIIGLIYDPGVIWQLIGSITFVIGAAGVLYTRLGEKPIELPRTHLQRMPFVVIEDKALGPVDVGLLGAVGIVLEPNCIAHLIEQLFGSLCHANLR